MTLSSPSHPSPPIPFTDSFSEMLNDKEPFINDSPEKSSPRCASCGGKFGVIAIFGLFFGLGASVLSILGFLGYGTSAASVVYVTQTWYVSHGTHVHSLRLHLFMLFVRQSGGYKCLYIAVSHRFHRSRRRVQCGWSVKHSAVLFCDCCLPHRCIRYRIFVWMDISHDQHRIHCDCRVRSQFIWVYNQK